MQEGRWESGLDNSPMYDAWAGDFADGKMQLYDTGMAAMHVMDTRAWASYAFSTKLQLGKKEKRWVLTFAECLQAEILLPCYILDLARVLAAQRSKRAAPQ